MPGGKTLGRAGPGWDELGRAGTSWLELDGSNEWNFPEESYRGCLHRLRRRHFVTLALACRARAGWLFSAGLREGHDASRLCANIPPQAPQARGGHNVRKVDGSPCGL